MTKNKESRGLGVASMVIGVTGLFWSWIPFIGLPFCVLGLLLGLLQKDWREQGISITGVTLNGIFVLIQVMWIFFMVVGLLAA